MTYRIKEVDGEESSDELRELHDATFGADGPVPDFTQGRWYMVYYKGDPVAFAGWRTSTLYPGLGYFERVGVLPIHRGNKLQQRLMRRIEKDARAATYTGIVSDTTDNVPSANNFVRERYTMFVPELPWSLPRALYWRKDFV